MAKTANMDFNRAAFLKFETKSLKPKRDFDLNDSLMSPNTMGSPVKRRLE